MNDLDKPEHALTGQEISDAREQFGFRLGRLARIWRSRLDERMRPHGLTQARWVVLMHLRRGGDGLQQKHLANAVGIEGPTLVHILDKLESQVLIERRTDKADRRGKTIHLTATGWRMMEVLDVVAADTRHENLVDISDADLARCLAVFERIENRARVAMAPGAGAEKLQYGTTGSDPEFER